jgi:hypothetical protein
MLLALIEIVHAERKRVVEKRAIQKTQNLQVLVAKTAALSGIGGETMISI